MFHFEILKKMSVMLGFAKPAAMTQWCCRLEVGRAFKSVVLNRGAGPTWGPQKTSKGASR